MKRASLLLLIAAALSVVIHSPFGFAQTESPIPVKSADNLQLVQLFSDDQADRKPTEGASIDWIAVTERDRAREAKVKELFTAGVLATAKDYYHAAMVLMHSNAAESHLLAHEFSVVAAIKGEPKAKWLVAASEDRFLMNIGRPQRFGTQYRSLSAEAPMTLHELDPTVTDGLRLELNVPSLEEAREREREMASVKARAN